MLASLSLAPTGETAGYLERQGASALRLASGWLLVFVNGYKPEMGSDAELRALSADGEVVIAHVLDTVGMWSAAMWRDGSQVWRAAFDSEHGTETVEVRGVLPDIFAELLRTVAPDDSGALEGHTHGDIPLLLAKEITGFIHNASVPEVDAGRFRVLRSTRPPVPWWKRLLGQHPHA